MTPTRDILLLASPGYRRNSMEAFLQTIADTAIFVADDATQARQILEQHRPVLLLVAPARLEPARLCAVCRLFRQTMGGPTALLLEPYTDNFQPEPGCTCLKLPLDSSQQFVNAVQGLLPDAPPDPPQNTN